MNRRTDFLSRTLVLCFAVSTVLSSCGALPGTALEIVSWSPGCDLNSSAELAEVKIIFNREPEPVCTGEAFSITADGDEPPGRVYVEGRTLIFSPYSPLAENTDYKIRVTDAAEDTNGNSLREVFNAEFRIGRHGQPPAIVSVSPADGTTTDNQQPVITLVFDTEVDFDSILSAFSISPSVKGISELSDDRTCFRFIPAEKLEWQQEYTVEISTELKSIYGYTITEEYIAEFKTGCDETPPFICSAGSADYTQILASSTENGEDIYVNTGWEKALGIKIGFSEPIDRRNAETAVSIDPLTPFDIDFNSSASPLEMEISFTDNLRWHELYRVEVSTVLCDLQKNRMEKDSIYYIYIDGPGSVPPQIDSVRVAAAGGSELCIYSRTSPASAVNSHSILDTSGGDATENPFFIDYYINLAEGAELPFFGLVENFLISPSDLCISVDYLDFQVFNPGDSLTSASNPIPAPEASQGVVRLITSLSDDAEQSGLILFQVYSEFADTLGNRMAGDWTAELFDEDS